MLRMSPVPAEATTFRSTSAFEAVVTSDRESTPHSLWNAGPNGLSVVIPAWNEEQRLPSTLDQYVSLCEAFHLPFEVIVVADGVTDRTVEVASLYSDRGVKVLRFDDRLGKGGAVLEGFRQAKYDIVGFLDADAPVTPVSLAYLIAELTSADGAVASRWIARSRWERRQPFSRRVFSRIWNLMTRFVLGLNLHDTQCGAKFFRREAVSTILKRVTLTNWAFDAALLFHFKRAGYTVAEVPVDWNDGADTKLSVVRVVPAMFLSLIGIRLMSISFLPRTTRAWAGRLHRYFIK